MEYVQLVIITVQLMMMTYFINAGFDEILKELKKDK